jgi:hypothetical protein
MPLVILTMSVPVQNSSQNTSPLGEPSAKPPEPCSRRNTERLIEIFESLVKQLQEENLTFAEWLVFIFEPTRRAAATKLRQDHFWRHTKTVRELLDSWTHAHQAESGRMLVVTWAIDFVAARMRTEAQQITRGGFLVSSNKRIGPAYLKSFRLGEIKATIQEHCSTSTKVLLSMAGVESNTRLTEAPMSAQNVSSITSNLNL